MKTLTDQLAQYAAYHRDRRNIATHFVGIPMIVVAVATLLSRPGLDAAGWLTPALLVTGLTVAYYLLLDLRFGLAWRWPWRCRWGSATGSRRRAPRCG